MAEATDRNAKKEIFKKKIRKAVESNVGVVSLKDKHDEEKVLAQLNKEDHKLFTEVIYELKGETAIELAKLYQKVGRYDKIEELIEKFKKEKEEIERRKQLKSLSKDGGKKVSDKA